MTDTLDDSRRFWDAHAQRDPLWAVLSDAGKEERKWDIRRFFKTGVSEIALVLYQLQSYRIELERGCALDFGCGVGRLTQALAPRFNRVVGLDVSPKMLARATALNAFPDRAEYICNDAPHLRIFADNTFDFVYTTIVLQHIAPELTLVYLREFIRILRPGGVLVFQLPSHQRRSEDALPESSAISMSEDAYQAALSVSGVPAQPLGPNAELTLNVDVTNISRHTWSQHQYGAFAVGNHWLDHTGVTMLQRDDGRTTLPDTLPPGGTCRLPLTIRTPAVEGDYLCEVDLAHEGVRWFCDLDSTVVRFALEVRGGVIDIGRMPPVPVMNPAGRPTNADNAQADFPTAAPGDESLASPGDFPMYGVQTDIVEQVITSSGGDLLQRTSDYSCGRTWISFKYWVKKRSNRIDSPNSSPPFVVS